MKADIITGQFVRISQTPATVAERIIARVIDYAILLLYFSAVTVVFFKLDTIIDTDDINDGLLILFVCLVYLPVLFYPFICEAFFNGQTIGKRSQKTRVVNADGSQPGIGQLFLRWLLLMIDEGFFFVGLIAIMLNRKGQRLGDMAAGTYVIRLQNFDQLNVTLEDFQYANPDYRPVYPQAANLSIAQAEVIRKALNSGTTYNGEQLERLAAKVEQTLSIQRREPSNISLLLTILHDYQYYALELV